MYKELLEEYEQMKLAGEDMEAFANNVLNAMEKEAALGGIIKAVGGAVKGAGKFVGGVAASPFKGVAAGAKTIFGGPASQLPKRLFAKNFETLKSLGPIGWGLTALPVLSGQQNVVEGAADAFSGGLFSGIRQVSHDFKSNAMQNRMPVEMFRAANDDGGILKEAAIDDKIKDIIKNLAVIGGLGLGGLAAGRGIGAFIDRNPDISRGFTIGVDKAIGGIGKGTMKTFNKSRPFTSVISTAVTSAGKIAEKLDPSAGKLRADFSTLTGKPTRSQLLRNLGLYLAGMTAVSMGEDFVTDKLTNALNAVRNKPVIPDDKVRVDVINDRPERGRPPRDRFDSRSQGGFSRNRFDSRRPGGPRPYQRDRGEYRPRRYEAMEVDALTPDITPEVSDDNETFAFSRYLESLEKLAMTDATKRLIGDNMIRPAVTTGAFLLSLAGLSRLLGRNLYGGMERVRTDDQVRNKGRIIIDIPSDYSKKKDTNMIIKKASATGTVEKILGKAKEGRLEKIKQALDAKIVKGPKFVRKLDDLLAAHETAKYEGKHGLAHFVTEEVPYRAVNGMAYASPMVLVGALTGRNIKRAFEPIISDPNVSAPPGMTRIIIEDHSDDKPEKKAATNDTNKNGIDDVIEGIIKNPERPYITNNKKKLQEKKAADESIEILDKAFPNELERKIAYMIATSHEYKKPNTDAAISFVKNYKWELSTAKVSDLQGIDKPIIEEKVEGMVKTIKDGPIAPFITVNQFHGIRPQTPGKKILVDGHHRKEACIRAGITDVPIYKGTYTGNAEKSTKELVDMTKAASLLSKIASLKK